MGQKEKLIKRLKSKPKDFTFEEAETLLKYFDYIRSDKGKTSGSRVILPIKTVLPFCCINRIRAKNCLPIK